MATIDFSKLEINDIESIFESLITAITVVANEVGIADSGVKKIAKWVMTNWEEHQESFCKLALLSARIGAPPTEEQANRRAGGSGAEAYRNFLSELEDITNLYTEEQVSQGLPPNKGDAVQALRHILKGLPQIILQARIWCVENQHSISVPIPDDDLPKVYQFPELFPCFGEGDEYKEEYIAWYKRHIEITTAFGMASKDPDKKQATSAFKLSQTRRMENYKQLITIDWPVDTTDEDDVIVFSAEKVQKEAKKAASKKSAPEKTKTKKGGQKAEAKDKKKKEPSASLEKDEGPSLSEGSKKDLAKYVAFTKKNPEQGMVSSKALKNFLAAVQEADPSSEVAEACKVVQQFRDNIPSGYTYKAPGKAATAAGKLIMRVAGVVNPKAFFGIEFGDEI